MGTVHDFKTSLAKSKEWSKWPLWRSIYVDFFGGGITLVSHDDSDGWQQRAGIDRSIIMPDSQQHLVDEKVRFPGAQGQVFPDIALEYLSDAERNKPGWVCKSLRCDYIAYLVTAGGVCHILPVPQLQRAWLEHGDLWRNSYRCISALNTSWVSKCCCVPVKVVYAAIGQRHRIRFKPFKRGEAVPTEIIPRAAPVHPAQGSLF